MARRKPILPPERFRLSGHSQESLNPIYASMVPFAVAEYLIERLWSWSPTGILFPIGFLLFWTFYYIYFRSVMLSQRLQGARGPALSTFFVIVAGVIVWFFRATFGEIFNLFRSHPPTQKQQALPPETVHHRKVDTTPQLPFDALQALRILGLRESCDWNDIHKRYRDLAKRFHPDLHPDQTSPGLRFRQIDSAYRRLENYRHLF